MPRGWDYRTLAEKYLLSADSGIWEEREPRVLRMYRVLSRLTAPELTIFLLVVELGSQAEVARRLKVHRSTIMRIYHRIERRIKDGVQGH